MLSYHKGDYVLRIFRNFDEMETFLINEMLFHTDDELAFATNAIIASKVTGKPILTYIDRYRGDNRRLVSWFKSLEMARNDIFIYHDYFHDIDYCPPGVKED